MSVEGNKIQSEEKYVWFTMMPNIVDEMELGVYEFRIYLHLRRRYGENHSPCWEGTRAMARICKMSVGKVSAAKQSLRKRGLIHIEEKKDGANNIYHSITILDIWPVNYDEFHRRSSGEQGGCSCGEHPCSCGELKNNHRINNHVPEPAAPVGATAPARKPTRKPRKQRSKKPVEPKPPAVKRYEKASKLRAKKATWDTIREIVGAKPADLSFWEKVVRKYILLGWSPVNIDGMLEWFQKRELPHLDRDKGGRRAKTTGGRDGDGRDHEGLTKEEREAVTAQQRANLRAGREDEPLHPQQAVVEEARRIQAGL